MKAEPGPSAAVAVWLLQCLGSKASLDALIGDLLERMTGGQTSAWLWREVFIVLAHRVGKTLLTHWQELGSVRLEQAFLFGAETRAGEGVGRFCPLGA